MHTDVGAVVVVAAEEEEEDDNAVADNRIQNEFGADVDVVVGLMAAVVDFLGKIHVFSTSPPFCSNDLNY